MRFILISRSQADPEKADKTMIVFTLPNTPGALFKALSVFALRDINLTKLESRPLRGRPRRLKCASRMQPCRPSAAVRRSE